MAIVQQFFIAERAATLDLDLVTKQIRECHSSSLSYSTKILSSALIDLDVFAEIIIHCISGQSKETLHFLHTHPANDGWLTIITIRGREFIKINRHKSINAMIDTVRGALQK